ncbi:MAG: LamG-like jellyroll fold domain-containing protein [Puniceicoccaceae bacterium]
MRYKSILLFPWLFFLPALVLPAGQTLYRYEGFYPGNRPANVTAADPVETLEPGFGQLVRGASGDAFGNVLFGVFRDDSAYVFESFPGEGLMEAEFTVEAFFRVTEDLAGMRVIAGDEPVSGGSGWSLFLVDGKPAGRFWPEGGGIPHDLVAESALVPGTWYRLVYRYNFDSGNSLHEHDLWLDSQRVAHGSVIDGNGRQPSPSTPVVGAARAGGASFTDWLSADVMAVQVHDYALSDYFLSAPVIRDGSPYFGIPAFHNYIGLDGGTGGNPLERRLFETVFNPDGTEKYSEYTVLELDHRILPLLNDGYVVQGMAGDAENRRLYLSMYHRTVSGVSYTYPSVVVEISLTDYRLERVFVLHDETGASLKSHVGGIAYWDNLLFVPGPPRSTTMDPDIYVYDLSGLPPATFNPHTLEGFTGMNLDATWKLRDPIGVLGDGARFNSISFMGIHMNAKRQLMLHLGNFQSNSAAPVHLFQMNVSEGEAPELTYEVTHIESHRRTQSVHYYFESDVSDRTAWKNFQATSYGNNDSVLYSYNYLTGREAPFGSEVMRMPAGLEEVFSIDKRLWLTSESGSLYYQKRTNPWTDFFPFLCALDASANVDPNDNGINEQWEAGHGLFGQQDPDVDMDGDGFSLRQEYDWDTDPGNPLSYPDSTVAMDFTGVKLHTSLERFYTLQETSDLLTWITIEGSEHRRGTDTLQTLSTGEPVRERFYRVLVEHE